MTLCNLFFLLSLNHQLSASCSRCPVFQLLVLVIANGLVLVYFYTHSALIASDVSPLSPQTSTLNIPLSTSCSWHPTLHVLWSHVGHSITCCQCASALLASGLSPLKPQLSTSHSQHPALHIVWAHVGHSIACCECASTSSRLSLSPLPFNRLPLVTHFQCTSISWLLNLNASFWQTP